VNLPSEPVTPAEMLEQTEEFMSAAGLGDALAELPGGFTDSMISFIAGFGLIFQDVMIGDGKDCDCGSCVRLREMAGTFDQHIAGC
jgi:hypothetical protein